MLKVQQRGTGFIAVTLAVIACLVFGTATQAQMPTSPWKRGAPFPEPEEELDGAAANGKMYVMGGYGEAGKPVGMVWEYDPANDKWTKKKDMALPWSAPIVRKFKATRKTMANHRVKIEWARKNSVHSAARKF